MIGTAEWETKRLTKEDQQWLSNLGMETNEVDKGQQQSVLGGRF